MSPGSGRRRSRLLPMMCAPTDAYCAVFPFRYRDARTGKWVKARYMATREEIASRYGEWEITGPGEVRTPRTGYFNPGRREGE